MRSGRMSRRTYVPIAAELFRQYNGIFILTYKLLSTPLCKESWIGEAETEELRPDKNCRGCPRFINRQILISGYLRETAAKIKTLFPDVFH